MKRMELLGLALLGAVLVACSHSKTMEKGQIKQSWEQEQVQKNYIEVRGIGAADPTATSDAQKKYTSREAAIIDAQAKILEIIKGLEIEGVGTASKAMLVDQQLTKKIQGAIRGATEVKTEWDSQMGCVVTMHLDKRTLKDIDARFKL
jgi:hypothetical protein